MRRQRVNGERARRRRSPCHCSRGGVEMLTRFHEGQQGAPISKPRLLSPTRGACRSIEGSPRARDVNYLSSSSMMKMLSQSPRVPYVFSP